MRTSTQIMDNAMGILLSNGDPEQLSPIVEPTGLDGFLSPVEMEVKRAKDEESYKRLIGGLGDASVGIIELCEAE